MMAKIIHVDKLGKVHVGLQLIRNRKSMWCMIKDTWHGHYKMSGLTKFLLVTGTLYILLPFDFDWLPIVGWIDDGLVFYLLIKRLQVETQRYIRAKVMERKGEC